MGSSMGVSLATCQSGTEASFRKQVKSGRRSISEAITAGSILSCWLVVVGESQRMNPPVLDFVVWMTSRWPMSFEANSEVPPCSLAEQRKMKVLEQFSAMVPAALLP